jgi:hypothetical protein
MTIQDVARNEGISERQAQRYCAQPGFRGNVLKASKIGRAFVIAAEDYKAWRIACGFDFLPQPDGAESAPLTSASSAPKLGADADSADHLPVPSVEPGANPPGPSYPPYPQAADPHGVPTNVPHEHSSTMPHPQACADYFAEQARKMKAQIRGYDND